MKMYHPIKVGCKKISSSIDTVETVTFHCRDLTLMLTMKIANKPFMTLWPMMLLSHTKSGYRRFSS